jgi:hypothetical protein
MTAVQRFKNYPVTIERLEAALVIVARAVVLDGPIYAPLFDRLEREIAALRAADDAVARAQRYLAARGFVRRRNLREVASPEPQTKTRRRDPILADELRVAGLLLGVSR